MLLSEDPVKCRVFFHQLNSIVAVRGMLMHLRRVKYYNNWICLRSKLDFLFLKYQCESGWECPTVTRVYYRVDRQP